MSNLTAMRESTKKKIKIFHMSPELEKVFRVVPRDEGSQSLIIQKALFEWFKFNGYLPKDADEKDFV